MNTFAALAFPRPEVENGWTYWVYREGGHNPADGSYGRAGTREDALRIWAKMPTEAKAPPFHSFAGRLAAFDDARSNYLQVADHPGPSRLAWVVALLRAESNLSAAYRFAKAANHLPA